MARTIRLAGVALAALAHLAMQVAPALHAGDSRRPSDIPSILDGISATVRRLPVVGCVAPATEVGGAKTSARTRTTKRRESARLRNAASPWVSSRLLGLAP